MILQLNEPLWFNTPKGEAVAHFLIDRGFEHDLEWVCFVTETGECWTFSNQDIRIQKNITIGRVNQNEPKFRRVYNNRKKSKS